MANIKDIAKKAGVSTATVSRVLNGHPYVSERSRPAVEEAIRQLNYTPNSSAVHLKRGKNRGHRRHYQAATSPSAKPRQGTRS
jgi:DNA-binding LacI/PurR family transcriptional regulator